MNGSHLALGAVAALAAIGAMSKRGSRARYVARGTVRGIDPDYEFEFDSDCKEGEDERWDERRLERCLQEDGRRALINADYDPYWKEILEEAWRNRPWNEGDWDSYMEVEEADRLSIRDAKGGRERYRPPLLEGGW